MTKSKSEEILARTVKMGIKVCGVSNFIYTGRFFLEEEGDLFFSMKRDQREKQVLLQDM